MFGGLVADEITKEVQMKLKFQHRKKTLALALPRFLCILTLKAPTPQNSQTHANNLLAVANELLECVGTFCGVGT